MCADTSLRRAVRFLRLCCSAILAVVLAVAGSCAAAADVSSDSNAVTATISDQLEAADAGAQSLAEEGHGPAGCAAPHRFWVRGEYLTWWTSGNRLPPLLTTGLAGTDRDFAGVLGQAGTSLVFGDQRVDQNMRSGLRLRAGYWFDVCQHDGLEADWLSVGDGANTDFATPLSTGTPILARPLINAQTGLEDAQLVAYPGLVDGRMSVRTTSELDSVAVLLRRNWRDGPRARWDLVGGYRFLQFGESVVLSEHLISRAASPVVLPGTLVDVTDDFHTQNIFHGGEMGLDVSFGRGPLTVDVLAKVALGNVHQRIEIQGVTQVTKPGDLPFNQPGGLLALPSNAGVQTHDEFAVLPEVGLNLQWQIAPRLSLTGGCTWLLLTNVVRAGDQIDRHVDPSQLSPLLNVPAASAPAALRPAVPFDTTTFWAGGANVGLQLSF
jgi:hypothetical protein